MAKSKPAFDPQKNYKWEPSDSFTISGEEFASLYHCLVQEMNTAGGAPISLIVQANEVILNVLRREVASGLIEEADLSPQLNQVDNNVKAMFNNK